MTWHGADIGAMAGFIAGGGLSGMTAFAAVVDPKHAMLYAAGMGAVISIAGMVRVIASPTPTNNVTLVDRNTGATVNVRTVDAPVTPNK